MNFNDETHNVQPVTQLDKHNSIRVALYLIFGFIGALAIAGIASLSIEMESKRLAHLVKERIVIASATEKCETNFYCER